MCVKPAPMRCSCGGEHRPYLTRSLLANTGAVTIALDGSEQARYTGLGRGIVCLRDDCRGSSFGANELAVEGFKINLLVILHRRAPAGPARTDLILNDDRYQPAVGRMGGRDLQGCNGGDFAQVFALLITEVKVCASGDLALLGCAPCRDLQGRGSDPVLGNDPANDLVGIYIYGEGFHSGYPPSCCLFSTSGGQ